MTNNTEYDRYEELERDSAFELPELGETFNGWYLSQSLSGTAYRGYQKLDTFADSSFNANNAIIFYS